MVKSLLSKANTSLAKFFSLVENKTPPISKVVFGFVLFGGIYILYQNREIPNIADSTVMITSLTERSGGSGVILESSGDKTLVLTNKHVCEVVVSGGLIKTTKGEKHTILEYQESETHDLCLITVAAKLMGSVKISSQAPKVYEHAIVSGHPALLPNVITEGHFSGNRIIDVFVNMRPCTDIEKLDPNLGPACLFFNGLPVVKSTEAVLVTATIMPGSSGSAVYTSDRKLGGLVFAGSGELGYAFVVPYEFLVNFLTTEVATLPKKRPNYTLDVVTLLNQQKVKEKTFRDLEKKCLEEADKISNRGSRERVEHLCDIIVGNTKWLTNL